MIIGTIESLHKAAQTRTGHSDFGDAGYLDGFARLLFAYDEEADLTPLGLRLAREELIGILVGRLLSEEGWRRFPAHADVVVRRPVFIVGMPRSGTTTLHRMLAADPDHQGLQTWLGFAPQPRPDRATWAGNPAFERTRAGITEFLDAHPGYAGVHNRRAEEVEECWTLTRQSVQEVYFEFTSHLPSYREWRLRQDPADAYRRHRRNLQLIGLHEPGKRWILKYAGHLMCLDALLSVYPDALIVRTHRRPSSRAFASTCSMVRQLAAGRSKRMTDDDLGPALLELFEPGLAGFADARRRYPADTFHDVEFAELTSDPLGVVAGIYARLDTELTEQARERMAAAYAAEDRLRSHRYELADFGLTAAEVDSRLGQFA